MGREEQREEREVALASIFPDEITGKKALSFCGCFHTDTLTNTDVSNTEYRISITLEAPADHDENAPDPRQ